MLNVVECFNVCFTCFYAGKQNASRVFAIVWASVCLSVRPSVCQSHSWSVSKRWKLGSRNLHHGCLKVSSFWWQNFVTLSEEVPLEQKRQRGVAPKNVILPLLARIVWKRLQIGTYLLLGDRLFRFISIDNLERPWTLPPKGAIFLNDFEWPWTP